MNDKPTPVDVPQQVTANARIFTVLIIACLVVYLFSVPVSLAALVLAPVALVFGIRALIAARGNPKLGGIRISVIFGLGLCLLAIVVSVGQLAIYDLIQEQRACESRALTNAAQRECQAQFDEAYQERLERWGVTLP